VKRKKKIVKLLPISGRKDGHYIPTGSAWFDLVACPHFTVEILMYLSLWCLAGWTNVGWISVVSFVVANQVETALGTDAWYREKFREKYPRSRKAIIPYLL
jgi:steroid 5-alpha-reductase